MFLVIGQRNGPLKNNIKAYHQALRNRVYLLNLFHTQSQKGKISRTL
jgi:hypothetical protein